MSDFINNWLYAQIDLSPLFMGMQYRDYKRNLRRRNEFNNERQLNRNNKTVGSRWYKHLTYLMMTKNVLIMMTYQLINYVYIYTWQAENYSLQILFE